MLLVKVLVLLEQVRHYVDDPEQVAQVYEQARYLLAIKNYIYTQAGGVVLPIVVISSAARTGVACQSPRAARTSETLRR